MKITLTLILLIFSAASVKAQQPETTPVITVKQRVVKSTLDTNELVYNASGQTLRYYQSQKLLNSGNYTINIEKTPNEKGSRKVIRKISPENQEKVNQMIKNLMVIKSPLLQENMVLDFKPLSKIIPADQLENKVILLVFWNVNCPPCTEAFSDIDRIVNELGSPKDLLVLALTTNSKSIATAKLAEKPFLTAQLVSNASEILDKYQISAFPSYVVADKNRNIKFAITGMSQIVIPEIKRSISDALNSKN